MKVALPLSLLVLLAGARPAVAQAPASGIEAQIKATLEQRFPGHPIEAVHAASMPGLYEVVTSSEILYTDSQADTLFVGQMIDTRTHEDLIPKRWNDLHPIDFNKLPFDQAIKIVRGDGSRTVAVFADPHCPYCQQLEHSIKDLTNLTIYVFLYPLEDLHAGATARAHAIWCSKDRAATWSSWMTLQVAPPDASVPCAGDPVQPLHELGQKLDISVTPTLFFADGHRFTGATSAVDFEHQLQTTERGAKH